MRWIADECVSARLVKLLREAGHDVAYVAEMAAGASDTDLIGLARRENRLLLTDDKDFGELVFRRRFPNSKRVSMADIRSSKMHDSDFAPCAGRAMKHSE